MTRARSFTPGEYYHVFSRGAQGQQVFKDKADYERFLFGAIYLQSYYPFPHVSRLARSFSDEGFRVPLPAIEQIITTRFVELTAFSIMPNHFHLLVREIGESGIATYLQRLSNGYTKYFNSKYETSGHVFQGRYRAAHVSDNKELLYLSAYMHRNPRDLKAWKDKETTYPWSSLQDYATANRWGGLLATDTIAEQFDAAKNSNYADFVKTSTAKILKEELSDRELL